MILRIKAWRSHSDPWVKLYPEKMWAELEEYLDTIQEGKRSQRVEVWLLDGRDRVLLRVVNDDVVNDD